MTKTLATFTTVATAVALMMPLAATAQQSKQPKGPDFGQMSAALGVSKSALKSCIPAPVQGQRPPKPDAAKLANCLKSHNAAVTPAKVDQALAKFAPKPKRG